MLNLILVGGLGKRLWPLSNNRISKSFIPLFNGESLLQRRYNLLKNLGQDCIIITNPDTIEHLYSNLPDLTETEVFICDAHIEVGGALVEIFKSDNFQSLLKSYQYKHVCIHYPDALYESEKKLSESLLDLTSLSTTINGTIILGNKNIIPIHSQSYYELGEDAEHDGLDTIVSFIGKGEYSDLKHKLTGLDYGLDDGILYLDIQSFLFYINECKRGECLLLESIYFSKNPKLYFYNINNPVLDVGSLKFLFKYVKISNEFKYNIKEFSNINTVVLNNNSDKHISVTGITDSLVLLIDDQLLVIHESMLDDYKNTLKKLGIEFSF